MALYIFQFGFLQPVASLVDSQVPVIIFSMILFVSALLNNKFRIKKYVFVVFLVISIYFLSSALALKENIMFIFQLYMLFLLKGFSAFFIASLNIKSDDIYRVFLNISVINFMFIVWFPFTHFMDSMNYMRFGYAMVPSTLMFIYASFDAKLKKILWIGLAFISTLLLTIYGSRGAFLVVLIFITVKVFFSSKMNILKKFFLVAIVGVFGYFTIEGEILGRFLTFLSSDLIKYSYAIEKFNMMITGGIAYSSSGRNLIYYNLFKQIINYPLWGRGIGYSQIATGYTAHNIFLQILVESGLWGLCFWSTIWGISFYKYYKIKKFSKFGVCRIISLLAIASIGRLLISSDMWLRPEYWFSVSLLLNFSNRLNRERRFLYETVNLTS